MTEIWFIRHGETDWNRARRLQGWKDIALNDTGIEQARLLCERLEIDAGQQPFDAIYSSDLLRAHATAQPIAQQLGLRIRTEPGIRERGYGVLEGLDMATSMEVAPEAHAAWKSRDAHRMLEGGESLGQFQSRVVSTAQDLAKRHEGQRLMVFTHGGVLDILWRRANGIALDAPRGASLQNVSINRIGIDGEDWRILGWGDVAHMALATGDDLVP